MASFRPRILCIDDEPSILEVLEIILKENGYWVCKAQDGEEGLKKLTEEKIDLVLLDIKIPKIDGYQLCQRIKSHEGTLDIPVVMVTGLSAKEERVRGIEAGADGFITKPFSLGELLVRVKVLLMAKMRNEARFGTLLYKLGFIDHEQLTEAVAFSKEQWIRMIDALEMMGIKGTYKN